MEDSLSTRLHGELVSDRGREGDAEAFADLPAASGEAFAAAVSAIERFLVPFECWSLVEYSLYREEGGTPKLARINNAEKAAAFLKLLNLTIGTTEGSVVPHDLSDALQQIAKISPALNESVAFQRLEPAARR